MVITGFICPDCRQEFRSSELLLSHHERQHAQRTGRASLPSRPVLEESKEDFLDQLAPQLAELKEMGLAMSYALDGHNDQLGRIAQKVDQTSDEMRLVTAKAARLRSQTSIRFQFRMAFQEVGTGLFVQVVDGLLRPTQEYISPQTIFRAFTVGEESHDVWGFQHEKSRHFIGLNRMGSLRVQGKALKSYEQFAIHVDRAETTLFSYASSFGSGGWVCINEKREFYLVRGTPSNKSFAARFRITKMDETSDPR